MKFEIPVYVAEHEEHFVVRPLRDTLPVVRAEMLERALARMRSTLRKALIEVAPEQRLEQLANYNYAPPVQEKFLKLDVPYQKRTARCRLLVVVLNAGPAAHRWAFFPALPDLWFQFHRGQNLKQRALDVLTQAYKKTTRDSPEEVSVKRAWTTEVELNFKVPEVPPKSKEGPLFMMLGGSRVGEGWEELETVGRCLDDLYPHDLSQCLCRDRVVGRLQRALNEVERAPQLLVGRPKVGKTAVVHQLTRLWVESKKGRSRRRFWLLSPQRLISGMSYVGQWESRVLAILKHAEKEDLVLVFDDLLGLFSAGISACSDLSVAQVLKPYLQRRQVRVIGEITHEALAVLKERDRGFADLFSLSRVEESQDAETIEILLEEMRRCEMTHKARFQVTALTTTLDLQRRYAREAAFPGKACNFLRRVAAGHRGEEVTDQRVFKHFQAGSGLSLDLLDDGRRLDRDLVVARLGEQVLGQPGAVEAAADAVSVAKARLCDPSRPVAGLLFVGPTGVGKTECAKALAGFLFGSPDRLLRFDMNEYVEPGSVSRLVGTFHQPEGLLTSAVRRQPFCVLLLDELEKAHHEVFNLLLQVLGDGRLTDSLGRTVDFTQAIIIMTSNLGVAEAGRPVGLRSKSDQEHLIYQKAVEDFFPPEFFNRLDRIVPFERLSREVTGRIAQSLLNQLLRREGLVRRQVLLEVEDAAREALVDRGYHPQLGARALKRAVEKELAGPLAARLSAMKPDAPTRIKIELDHGRLRVEAQEITAVPPRPIAGRPGELLASTEARLAELKHQWEGRSPEGLVEAGELTLEQLSYFNTQDRMRRVGGIGRRLRGYLAGKPPAPRRYEGALVLQAQDWESALKSKDLAARLKELAAALPTRAEEVRVQAKTAELVAELSLLEVPIDRADESTELELSWQPAATEQALNLAYLYQEVFLAMDFQVALKTEERQARLQLEGPQCRALAAAESGLHLFIEEELRFVTVSGPETGVIRVYDEAGTLDLRRGWMVPRMPPPTEFRLLMLGGL